MTEWFFIHAEFNGVRIRTVVHSRTKKTGGFITEKRECTDGFWALDACFNEFVPAWERFKELSEMDERKVKYEIHSQAK